MANKSNIVREYLNNIGTKNQIFFFFGKTPTTVVDDTVEATIDVWKNSDLSYRVGRKDSIAVIPNVSWSSGKIFKEWSTKTQNSSNYYAWNTANGIVYLCLSNNAENRKDLSLTSASTQIPSHAYGIKKYSDGYTWLPLYKITPDLLRFANDTWIPVISFDDFRTNETSRYTRAQSFCSNNQSATGNCGIYAKQTLQVPDTTSTFTTFSSGQLITTLSTTCKNCFYLYENDDRFISVFTGSSTPASTISVKTKFDEIETLVSNNVISKSSAYYALYQIAKNGVGDGAIVSALLDLSSFNQNNLVVSRANPEITITSNSGSNGRIRFKTYVNVDGDNIIEGVEVISNGTGYVDYALSIDTSIFEMGSGQVTALLQAIEINVDTIDGLNFDPVSVLESQNVMFDVRIETNILRRDGIKIPDEINFYGIVENPREYLPNGDSIISGSQYGRDYTYVESAAASVVLNEAAGLVPEEIDDGSGETTAGKQLSNLVVENITEVPGSFTNQKTVNVKNILYEDVENLSSVTVDSITYAVTSVQVPDFEQYSGKISQTKKLASSLIFGSSDSSSENTRIFRINIVKGF